MQPVNRRHWLKQTSLAALGLGMSLRSLAGEEPLPRNYFESEMGLINLGSNENPYGISPKAKQAIIDMLGTSNRYQFNIKSLQSFTKTLGEHYGVSEGQVIVTAGSGEGLQLLARHFSKGNIVAGLPTFGTLPNTAKRIGTKVIEVSMTADRTHDLKAMLAAINDETSLVYICNPANPTSTMLKPNVMKDFCKEASKKATVLIDEAYIDFLEAPDNESMIGLVHNNPNILVIRTFSKIHAMAGLRVGFIVGHADTINKIEPNLFQGTQMCLSVLSMTAALASLKDEAHQKISREKNAAARKFTSEELRKLKYEPVNSYTNFIMFPMPDYKGNFSEDMLKKNIILRYNNNAGDKWCRVSVGTMEEMKVFVSVMKTVAGRERKKRETRNKIQDTRDK